MRDDQSNPAQAKNGAPIDPRGVTAVAEFDPGAARVIETIVTVSFPGP